MSQDHKITESILPNNETETQTTVERGNQQILDEYERINFTEL